MLDDDSKLQMPLFKAPGETTVKPPSPPANPPTASAASPQVAQPEPPEPSAPLKTPATTPRPRPRKQASRKLPPAAKNPSGQVPDGDVRLTANIRQELHLKLKIAAAHRRTTIGELIEELVERHLKS